LRALVVVVVVVVVAAVRKVAVAVMAVTWQPVLATLLLPLDSFRVKGLNWGGALKALQGFEG
jgi:hypothetical protein